MDNLVSQVPQRHPGRRHPPARPDGRGLDYILHVNPDNKEKGMLLVFNPTSKTITKTLDIPLYYTGLTDTAEIRQEEAWRGSTN